MVAKVLPLTPDILRRVLRIQIFTIVWMSIEAAISLGAALTAHSPALLAFGGDSGIELLSAGVVLWRFRSPVAQAQTERRAFKIAGGLLFALAAYVVIASALALGGYHEAHPSLLGIALLGAAAIVMPWLGRQKRQLSVACSSAAMRADAAESTLCGYFAWIALAGLVANAIWGIAWADPVVALSLVPFILREGLKSIRGKPCESG